MPELKRNASAVLSQLVENQTGQVLTKVPCKIQVPVRFSTVGLGQVGIETFVYGCFPIILDSGEYSVCNVCALVELNPYKVTISTLDEVEYYNFFFEANQVVIKTTDVVKRDLIIYNVFDEFIFKGKIPWYMDYEDLGKLFDTSKEYANSNVNRNYEVIELIASIITRSKEDRTKYIRAIAKKFEDTELKNIDYVPLKSIYYSVSSNINKLAGSYFNDGVVSALVTTNTQVEKIESILRS